MWDNGMGSLQGGESALRYDDGLFYSSLEDDYVLPVPSHSPELERLDICHEIYRTLTGDLLPEEVLDYLKEDNLEKTILDLGSGTGNWAQDIALEYPHVQVYGIDLVDTPLASPPANTTFSVHNFLYGIADEDGVYDVVHVRDIALGVRDYPAVLNECVRVLKPGGYLVVQEMEWVVDFLEDQHVEEACPMMYQQKLHTAIEERGLDPVLGFNLDYHLSQVDGLSVSAPVRCCVPVAPGSSDETWDHLGRLSSETWTLFAESGRILFEDHGTFDSQDLSSGSLNELQNKDLYWFFDVCVARKDNT